MNREADLLQVILALSTSGCLTGLLDSGQKQRQDDSDDGDDDQQFNEGETASSLPGTLLSAVGASHVFVSVANPASVRARARRG
jgi:hypothetical protein